jgi:type I restriction enzyme, R subunit
VRDTHGLDHASHHRSQFGENHKGIKEFFPNSQLFGFTGTPIFEDNATVKQIEGNVATLRTTKDLFQKELHAYTITHAIEDRTRRSSRSAASSSSG